MPARSRLILAATLTFIVGLVIFFPARIAYQWFAPPNVILSGISGSAWYGSASEVSVNAVYVRDLHWRIRPQTLLTGKLGFAVEAKLASGFIEGNVAAGITGSIVATELRASLPLQSLQQFLGIPNLRGNLSVQFDRLRLEDGLPVAADGVVEVANLVLPKVHRGSIGGYRAEFLTQDDGIAASVEDTDGVVDIAGSLQVAADRNYQFIAQLAAKSDTPAGVRQQMQYLGSANARGQHELRLEGRL